VCSGSEAGSYLRLTDFVYHSTLGLRVIKKKRRVSTAAAPPRNSGGPPVNGRRRARWKPYPLNTKPVPNQIVTVPN